MTDMADESQRNARLWAEKVSPPYTSPGYIGTPSEIYNVARVILATVEAPALSEDLADIAERCEMWTADAITEALTAAASRAEQMEQENQEQREWNLAVNEQAGILTHERDEARADVKRLAATFKEHLKEPGHLPNPQIIRTVEELEALDPDTVLCVDREFATFQYADCTVSEELPAVVIRDGAEVRAALTALEKETNND